MAYAFVVSPAVSALVGGRLYVSWTVTETDVGAGDEYTIDGVPPFATLTLFEAELETAGDATTLAPEIGLAPAWTPDSLGEVAQVEAPASYFRIGCTVRVTAPDQKLVGRSQPDQGRAARVVTRLTIVEGHL